MTHQSALFSEDVMDALADVVRALGGAKAVGPMMRPDLPALQSAKWVLDCLNRERRERFSPDQFVWLLREGKKAGCHSLMHFLADEAGYTRPSPRQPEDELAELQRAFIESTRAHKAISERIERFFERGIK